MASAAFVRGFRKGFQELAYSSNPRSSFYQACEKTKALGIRFCGKEIGLTRKGVKYVIGAPLLINGAVTAMIFANIMYESKRCMAKEEQ